MDNSCKIVLFADGVVGLRVVEFILLRFPDDLAAIITTGSSSLVYSNIISINPSLQAIHFFSDLLEEPSVLEKLNSNQAQYFILAWWPYIIKKNIFSIPAKGTVNFHPSYLPYNRGKNYNFWTLIEDSKFGVTLHFVEESIDSGDILFQKEIPKTWEDTGETLYKKAQHVIVELFIESYDDLRTHHYVAKKQNVTEGTFHFAKELEAASTIHLDQTYTGREILNILRAKTFPPYPGAKFKDGLHTYEVLITIKQLS
jgi:methionyl-tRNA formyltransferase